MIHNFRGQLNLRRLEKLYTLVPISLIDTCQLNIVAVIESYEPRFKADILTFSLFGTSNSFLFLIMDDFLF